MDPSIVEQAEDGPALHLALSLQQTDSPAVHQAWKRRQGGLGILLHQAGPVHLRSEQGTLHIARLAGNLWCHRWDQESTTLPNVY